MAIPIQSPDEIARSAAAGQVLWGVLGELVALCRPGLSSRDINAEAAERVRRAGAAPILEGYTQHGAPPFPGAVCLCINEEVVHAPPSPRLLRAGDLVTIDLALALDGWCADAAASLIVAGDPEAAPPGSSPHEVQALLGATRDAFAAALSAAQPGRPWSDVARTMEAVARRGGFRLIPGYSGHGIGRTLHELPRAWSVQRPPPGPPEADFVLRPGMVLTIEPILTPGSGQTIALDDGWTVLTADRAPACHEERTLAITRRGPLVLTAPGPAGGLSSRP